MHTIHLFVPGKEIGDFHRVFRMRAHPPRQRAHATQNQPAIERRGDRSALVLNTADTLAKIILRLENDNPPKNITMAAEIFCRRMEDQVGTEIEWALQGARLGIIANADRTCFVDNLRNSGKIDNL